MKGKFERALAIIFAVLAFCGNAPLRAGIPSDLGTWNHVTVIKPIGKYYAMARLEHRSYENVGATEAAFAMAGAGYNFSKWLQGDVSYEYWKIPAAGDIVCHKAVFCLTGTLRRDILAVSLKEKYELAVNAGEGDPYGTLRTRLRAQVSPEGFFMKPYVISEFFNGFSGTGWIRSLHYVGADIPICKGNTLDVYYMYHLYNKGGSVASCNVLGLGYTLVF